MAQDAVSIAAFFTMVTVLMLTLLFAPLIAKVVACRAIRKMAEVLPEKDRERWIDEQMAGYVAAQRR